MTNDEKRTIIDAVKINERLEELEGENAKLRHRIEIIMEENDEYCQDYLSHKDAYERLVNFRDSLFEVIKQRDRHIIELHQRLERTKTRHLERVEELKSMIRELAWGDSQYCVYCKSHVEDGHRGNCKFAALLREGT